MPLKRLVAVEYSRRIRTWSRPFEGYAEDRDGQRFHVCVKPVIRGRPETRPTLGAEALAAHIAGRIVVPSPEAVLVEVESAFIAAAGGELSDVEPGLAFGSVWQEDSFPAQQSPAYLVRVSNPESVAGVTVLDSLLLNTDRHAGNALLVANGNAGVSFRLVFIDNALGQSTGISVGGMASAAFCMPRSELAQLVSSQEQFNPYLLSAEGLDLNAVKLEADAVVSYGWAIIPDYPSAVVQYLRRATADIRPVILSGLKAFPNCV